VKVFLLVLSPYDADRNAAFNIAYRALGYISKVGVTVNTLKTFPSIDRNAMMREARKRLPFYYDW
jgi:transposase